MYTKIEKKHLNFLVDAFCLVIQGSATILILIMLYIVMYTFRICFTQHVQFIHFVMLHVNVKEEKTYFSSYNAMDVKWALMR